MTDGFGAWAKRTAAELAGDDKRFARIVTLRLVDAYRHGYSAGYEMGQDRPQSIMSAYEAPTGEQR